MITLSEPANSVVREHKDSTPLHFKASYWVGSWASSFQSVSPQLIFPHRLVYPLISFTFLPCLPNYSLHRKKFETFTSVETRNLVFRVMTPCSLIDGTEVSEEHTACTFGEKVLRSLFLGNAGTHLSDYSAL